MTPWTEAEPRYTVSSTRIENLLDTCDLAAEGPALSLCSSKMQLLPTEIVLEIVKYLDMSAAFALRRTCGRFHDMIDVYIGDIFPPMVRPECWALDPDQLAFLSLLDRDNALSTSKMICSDCRRLVDEACFSPEARYQDPSVRKCIGHAGSIWICPHIIWSYMDIIWIGVGNRWHPLATCQCPVSLDSMPGSALSVNYDLIDNFAWKESHFPDIIQTLEDAKIQLCPHQRSDDQAILSSLHVGCPTLRPRRDSSHHCFDERHEKSRCQICDTRLHFYVDYFDESQRFGTFGITVTRLLEGEVSGSIGDVTDQRWMNQVTRPGKFVLLAHQWEQYMGKKAGRTGRASTGSVSGSGSPAKDEQGIVW